MKKFFLTSLQWLSAAMAAFIVCNCLLFLYNRPTAFVNRSDSSTNMIFYPGTTMLHGTEGWGYYKTDKNGYLNPELPQAERYCVAVGSSHTQGEEVTLGNRYEDVLNKMLGAENELKVYAAAQDGLWFAPIAKNFRAITSEFSDAQAIVIEINRTGYTCEELDDALEQKEYDPNNLGSEIASRMGFREKLGLRVKEALPIYTILKQQKEAYRNRNAADQSDGQELVPYEMSLHRVLELIRSEWAKPLIIVYHPTVQIREDGMLYAVEQPTDSIFERLCNKHGITFINVGEAFELEFRRDHTVPYGFVNTSPGTGHLNKDGHKIMAEQLFPHIKGVLEQ